MKNAATRDGMRAIRENMLGTILRPLRRRQQAEVTICIPAWQAESFIERTLHCACSQTHRRLRILVSVDRSDDATAELCLTHTRADRRIDVTVQSERLGWAKNVNFLLDRVETEFYFLYFHDDVLDRTYTARLLARLRERPDAASAHCDTGHFGASTHVSVGRDFEGSAAERLCTFLLAPSRGSPLRSLTRRSAVRDSPRLPTDAPDGFWANEPYLMQLIASGPALHVPEMLYKRWDKRTGGLTDGWKKLSREEVLSGLRGNTQKLLALIERVAADEAERQVLHFAAYVFMLRRPAIKKPAPGAPPLEPRDLDPAFAEMRLPAALWRFSPEIQDWARSAYAEVRRDAGVSILAGAPRSAQA